MSSFIQFADEFCNNLWKRLPEEYADCEVALRNVTRLNADKDLSVVISKPGESAGLTLNLYEVYSRDEGKVDWDKLVKAVVDGLKDMPSVDTGGINDYNWAKSRLLVRLNNAEKNKALSEQVPHRDFYDLWLTCSVVLSGTNEQDAGFQSVTVDNSLLKNYGVSEEKLFEDALENSAQLMPAKVDRMENFLPVSVESPEGVPALYVITNSRNFYGASAMLYPGVLADMEKKIGGDFYLIPSSVHEWLAVSSEVGDIEGMNELIRAINVSELEARDVLSDHAYLYTAKARK